ncbi:MAG: hypothetical protein ABII97_00605 [Patescibacteria group bacterium]
MKTKTFLLTIFIIIGVGVAIITFHGGRLYVAHEIETGLTTYKEFKFFSTIDQLEVSRDFIEKTISAYLEKLKKEQKTSWYFLHKTKYPTVNFSFDKNPVQEGNFTEETYLFIVKQFTREKIVVGEKRNIFLVEMKVKSFSDKIYFRVFNEDPLFKKLEKIVELIIERDIKNK